MSIQSNVDRIIGSVLGTTTAVKGVGELKKGREQQAEDSRINQYLTAKGKSESIKQDMINEAKTMAREMEQVSEDIRPAADSMITKKAEILRPIQTRNKAYRADNKRALQEGVISQQEYDDFNNRYNIQERKAFREYFDKTRGERSAISDRLKATKNMKDAYNNSLRNLVTTKKQQEMLMERARNNIKSPLTLEDYTKIEDEINALDDKQVNEIARPYIRGELKKSVNNYNNVRSEVTQFTNKLLKENK